MLHLREVTKLGTVEFSVELDGVRTRCLITVHALITHFGATEENAGRVLLAHLGPISAVAARVARRSDGNTRIVIRSADFDEACDAPRVTKAG